MRQSSEHPRRANATIPSPGAISVLGGLSEGALCAGLTNRPLPTIIRQTPAFRTRFRQISRAARRRGTQAPCVPGKASKPRSAWGSHRERAYPRWRGSLSGGLPRLTTRKGGCARRTAGHPDIRFHCRCRNVTVQAGVRPNRTEILRRPLKNAAHGSFQEWSHGAGNGFQPQYACWCSPQ